MTPQDITTLLTEQFGSLVQVAEPEFWQVESGNGRLLVLLSPDQSWVRSLVSIARAADAEPFLEQLLLANFDDTQEVRYALHQDVLWGVFQHSCQGLTRDDFQGAIARLLLLQQQGLSPYFNQRAESQIRQIIHLAKQQGQSLEATMQTLERFYEEGVMGEISQNAQQRQEILQAWHYQLERLWHEA